MMSKLTVGEDYLSSDLFDSWRYTGLSLASDESQLPPKLRGYAPEVSGIARTNAKVTVSQQGRVIYETTVAAGPFRIQELNSALTGRLDVRVEEQDGSVQTFSVETAQVPYLTRPGQLRYKMTTGRPRDYNHSTQGPYFATGELSWGLPMRGRCTAAAFSQDYNSLAVGRVVI
jgi:outer membrane usher protein FimD/PapC